MASEEDDESSELLSIDVEFVPPLTAKQVKQLSDPWSSLSYEEEFYLIYDVIAAMADDLNMVARIGSLAMIVVGSDPKKAAMAKDSALKAAKLAEWFSSQTGGNIPEVPKGAFVQPPNILDSKKLAWGQAVRDAILKSDQCDLLTAIWAVRIDELGTIAEKDAVLCADVEARALQTPKRLFDNHRDKCQVDAEYADHRRVVLNRFIASWRDRWARGEVHTSEDFDKAYQQYEKEHHDELMFLAQRRKAVFQRIKQRLESDPEYQKYQKEIASRPPIEALLDAIRGISQSPDDDQDCGNPHCPIHGTEAKKQKQGTEVKALTPAFNTAAYKTVQPSPTNDSPKSQLQQLFGTGTKKESMTMANTEKSNKDEIKFTNVGVQFVDDPNNKSIQLPAGMTLQEGRHWLQKIEEEETRTFRFEFKFTGWAPLDAMWAAYRALSELHGFVHVGDFQSFFGPTPPTMITIEVDFGVTQQMPWGPIEVSGFSAPLVPSLTLVEGHPTLMFSAKIRNNERATADSLMKKAISLLQTSSIYRGKAIDVDFEVVNPNDFRFDPHKAPKFWDTSGTKLDELILSKKVEKLIKTNIWTPIRKTAEARKHKIPLRRTTLLAGSYGVGKTLGARATAKIAQDNGWTFLYLRKLEQLKQALYFAKKYQPCVIFAEDINRITSGKRDEEMDALFNTVDGVDRKDDEVMLVFTTNDIEEIHPGMIRPGRIDTVIMVTPPDAEAAERLIRLYGRGLIEESADLKEVARKLAGQIPAIIREAVERSKLAAIQDNDGGQLVVSAEHLDIAADQMLEHAKFLDEPEEDAPDMEVFGAALGKALSNGFRAHGVSNDHLYIPTDNDAHRFEEDSKQGLRALLEDSNMTGKNGHGLIEG